MDFIVAELTFEGACRLVVGDIYHFVECARVFFLLGVVQVQVFRAYCVARSENDGALHDVFELTHVAGPMVAQKHVEGIGLDRIHGLLEDARVVAHEVVRDKRNVFGPILERRRIDAHDVNAVVEILAELAFGHKLGKVLMGGEDEARAQGNQLVRTQAVEFHLLQDAQQLDLGEEFR